MAHPLEFGKIHIIEWLWRAHPVDGQPDRPTGKEAFDAINEMLAKRRTSRVEVSLHQVASRKGFLATLKLIEADFHSTKRVPLLQIETHGVEDGIGLGNDGLTWPELTTAFTPLNIATRLRLSIFLAACHGVRGIRMFHGLKRAPFFAILGANRKVEPGQIVRAMRAFYQKVIVERDGMKAMATMNAIANPDEDTFSIYNCEQLFRDLWKWYREEVDTEEYIGPIVEEKLKEERHRTPEQIQKLRTYARDYVRDYTARFDEARRVFFMIDLYPENNRRFTSEEPVG